MSVGLESLGGEWGLVALGLALVLAYLLARERARAERRVLEATRELRALSEFQEVLLTELDLRRVLHRVTRRVAPDLGFDRATVYLLDPDLVLEGQAGHSTTGELQPRVRVPLPDAGPLGGALFGPPEGIEADRLVALPILGPTPPGANALCWLEPERRCTVAPAATSATREAVCPRCPNFAPLGVLEAEHGGRRPAGSARLPDYARAGALAVQNARLYARAADEGERARRGLAQLELIHEVGREVGRALHVDAVLERMARGLHERLGYARVSVALVTNGRVRGHMTLVNGRSRMTGGYSRIDFDVATHPDPFAQVARTGEGLIIRDATSEARLPTVVRETVRTIGYAPIVAAGENGSEVLGVLAVDHGEAMLEISATDLEVLATLGAQVGVALSNAREFAVLAEREREARAAAELGRALTARPGDGDADGWLDALCDAAVAYAGADFASITRLESARGVTAASSAAGRAESRALPPGPARLTEAVLATGEALVVPDATQDPRAADEAAIHGPAALLVLPLAAGGRGLGALILGRRTGWSPEDASRLSPVAQQLALALENAELYRGLREERARLADALENLADGVLLLEGEGGTANAAARALLGLGDRFARGELPAQLRAALDFGRAGAGAPASLVVGEARLQVAVTRRGDLTIVVLQDVARFRAVEQAKAELLSVVSHELRTPLTAIMGFVELLLRGQAGPLSPDQTDFLVTTLDESRRLHGTVQNLLDASRLEAGSFELQPRAARLDFADLLERASRAAAEKGVGFEADFPAQGRLVVDAARLELVLGNLLSNALRYTPPGGTVTVRGGLENGQLRFSVADTGPGMSPAQLANLFRRFSRGSESRESLEGAGLSLYVSRAIVVAHGGRIWAESAPGLGTTMHVRLPAVPVPERALA